MFQSAIESEATESEALDKALNPGSMLATRFAFFVTITLNKGSNMINYFHTSPNREPEPPKPYGTLIKALTGSLNPKPLKNP